MKKFTAIFLSLLMIALFVACTNQNLPSGSDVEDIKNSEGTINAETLETRIIIDAYGREVEIPSEINSIICTGSGALRMVSYLKATDLLVGIEEIDTQYETSTKRDYAYVYHDEFKSLPVIGKGGGTGYTAYPEEIINISPDIIVTCYQPEALEQLVNETGIPVVSVRYTSNGFINETLYSSMEILGNILNRSDRTEDLLSYIDSAKADLNNRTINIPDETKPTVYTGAVTFSGAHGFSGTYSNFGPFMAINALNVADEIGEEGSYEVDLEKVAVWDPDIIFLDPGNMNLVNEEYNTSTNFFKSLSAVQEGKVYTLPSFNNYSTNITYCLMDSYFAGSILYPEEFSDIEMKEKGNEILEKFFGYGYFNEMEADGLYFGKIVIGE
jgi:iron complex transport system substrate-binding protein